MPLSFTAEALDDLGHIREFIGKDNFLAANRIAVQILAACDRLEYLPERGRPGIVPDTRELVALWPYVIVYEIQNDDVIVLRVWHGAQER